MKVRKVRGLILDKLYAELKRCGDLSCAVKGGRHYTAKLTAGSAKSS